jgi:hypothetical protein
VTKPIVPIRNNSRIAIFNVSFSVILILLLMFIAVDTGHSKTCAPGMVGCFSQSDGQATSRELHDQDPSAATAAPCALPGSWTNSYGAPITIKANLSGTLKLSYCNSTHTFTAKVSGNSFSLHAIWHGGKECQGFTESMSFGATCRTAGGTWINDDKKSSGTDSWSRALINVSFKEYGTTFGWDDRTTPDVPWKSVGKGGNDSIKAAIDPADSYKSCLFESSNTSFMTVSPDKATSASQTLKAVGVGKGSTALNAKDAETKVKNINVATYNPLSKTVAVTLVHKKSTGATDPGYTSTNISDTEIKNMLKTVYKQSAKTFTLTRLAAKTVAFDTNKDGKLDVDSWMSAEMQIIRDACKSNHDYNIFIVSHPSDGSTGFMSFNQKYGFIHADTGGNSRTVSHELGHGQGLQHTPDDVENIMYNYTSTTKWRLRKTQWDTVNP